MSAPDSLAKAIAALGAVEVAPGRYAWTISVQGPWVTASAEDLLKLRCECFGGDEIPVWPGNGNPLSVVMPPWWSPESRFAWRIWGAGDDAKVKTYGPEGVPQSDLDAFATKYGAGAWAQRITASLETGEEVPA